MHEVQSSRASLEHCEPGSCDVQMLGGSSQDLDTWLINVNNHSKIWFSSPKDRVVGPLPNGLNGV